MFDLLATIFQGAGQPRSSVFEVHPGQLSRWLEELWGSGPGTIAYPPPIGGVGTLALGSPNIVNAMGQPPAGPGSFGGPSGINAADASQFTALPGPMPPTPFWHHLSYAYLIENTGVVEILAEVVRRAAYGESLEIVGNTAVQWLRATEDLFFSDPPLFSIGGTSSQMRPETRIVRRNAYWRMFGMDLSHPIPALWQTPAFGNQPWKQNTGNGVNATFREKWAELLRQVWLGYENRANGIGPNATDDAYLLLLCDSLRDMLTMRRRGGFLAREEFSAVANASWFELTLSENTPIVLALKAQATSPADRLALIAQRLGMTPAPRSRELFQLAGLMSLVLRWIESGAFTSATVATLYLPGTIATTMNQIVDLWQSATGERVKDRIVSTVPLNAQQQASAQPIRVPGSEPLGAPVAAGMNGAGGRK